MKRKEQTKGLLWSANGICHRIEVSEAGQGAFLNVWGIRGSDAHFGWGTLSREERKSLALALYPRVEKELNERKISSKLAFWRR